MDETASGSWPEEWTRRIGRTLAALRAERGVSGRELSERCGTLGHPMPRNVIANLESGRKTSVPVHELAVLAMALGVPPVRLLYDLAGEDVEVLPDMTVSPWSALQWLTGELPLWLGYRWGEDPLGPTPEEQQRYEAGAAPLIWLRRHDEIAQRVVIQRRRVLDSLRIADAATEGQDRDDANRFVELERQHLLKDQESLQSWRQRMLLEGLRPPPVRPDLLPPGPEEGSSADA
jgi:transcriptional regulator with XRE-family HTH domain